MSQVSTIDYSPEQSAAWLRGLVSIAWADGDFSESEKGLIKDLVTEDLPVNLTDVIQQPISPEELALQLGSNPKLAENFLRTAVMVALADGVFTSAEDNLLHDFSKALKLEVSALESLRHTLIDQPEGESTQPQPAGHAPISLDALGPVRHWLDDLEVHDPRVARFLCKLIPPQCPFERDIKLFGRKIVHIPPLCKLNPLYEQLVGLRFRALSYLADDCQEDISEYC